LQNFGHAVASNIHGKLAIRLITIPGKQSVRTLGEIDLTGTQNLEAVPGFGTQQIIEPRGIVTLSQKEHEDVDNGDLSVIVDGDIFYDNGFGTEINQPICYAEWHYNVREPNGVIDARGRGTRPCREFYRNLPVQLEERDQDRAKEKKQGQPTTNSTPAKPA
jgi:hypothetical protein